MVCPEPSSYLLKAALNVFDHQTRLSNLRVSNHADLEDDAALSGSVPLVKEESVEMLVDPTKDATPRRLPNSRVPISALATRHTSAPGPR